MRSTPYIRPPSKKMLAHLKRVHKLVKERTKVRRAEAAEKVKKTAEAAEARKSSTPQPTAS